MEPMLKELLRKIKDEPSSDYEEMGIPAILNYIHDEMVKFPLYVLGFPSSTREYWKTLSDQVDNVGRAISRSDYKKALQEISAVEHMILVKSAVDGADNLYLREYGVRPPDVGTEHVDRIIFYKSGPVWVLKNGSRHPTDAPEQIDKVIESINRHRGLPNHVSEQTLKRATEIAEQNGYGRSLRRAEKLAGSKDLYSKDEDE